MKKAWITIIISSLFLIAVIVTTIILNLPILKNMDEKDIEFNEKINI